MPSFGNMVLLGAGAVGIWYFFMRESYFVERSGSHPYEYFSDLGAARAYAKAGGGALYSIHAGGEFDEKTARRMTPNRSKRARSKKRR